MRRIELLTLEDLPLRIENIKKSLEEIYGVELSVEFENVSLDRLYPTEEFLEKDKLALVFVKRIKEGYDIPIIAVKRGGDYFILDGHHRSFISKKMMKNAIRAYVLKFPKDRIYRDQPKNPLENLPIKDVAEIDNSLLKA